MRACVEGWGGACGGGWVSETKIKAGGRKSVGVGASGSRRSKSTREAFAMSDEADDDEEEIAGDMAAMSAGSGIPGDY